MNSLRRQLTRELLAAVAGLVGLGLAAIALAARYELIDAFDATLRTRAQAVASLTEYEDGRIDFDFSPEFLRSFGGDHPKHYFEIWSEGGIVLTRSPSLGSGDLPRFAVGNGGRSKYRNLDLPSGRPGRMVALESTVKPADAEAAASPADSRILIAVASDRADLDETLAALWAATAASGGLLLVAVGWGVPRVLRRGLSPLERFADQAARIDADSLATRFPISGLPSELEPIAARLNELLARLERSFERERRFSADLAHELRTPLSELRSLAECSIKWPESRDPSADQETLAIAAQMEALVSRMLTLARGERNQLPARLEPAAIDALAFESWKPFSERAKARGLRPAFTLEGGTAQADSALLRSILSNLYDNAVDYAPVGAELRISGAPAGSGYVLRVSNPAGDLTPDDVARIFDRFWRKEAARSGGGEHVGLGLSLARAFATAMGWRLDASLDAQGWIVFTIVSGQLNPEAARP